MNTHPTFILASFANEEKLPGKNFLALSNAIIAAESYADINEVPVRIMEHTGNGSYRTVRIAYPDPEA